MADRSSYPNEAGPSRPRPTPSADAPSFLATSRSRRSTAGNRMKALMDQEIQQDELFQEVEDDVDFQEQHDEHDIVDSDFDRDSSDGRGADGGSDEDDDQAGERQLEELERAQRKAKRARAVPVQVRRPAIRAAPPKPATRDRSGPPEDAPPAIQMRRDAKRRRISFAPDQVGSDGVDDAAEGDDDHDGDGDGDGEGRTSVSRADERTGRSLRTSSRRATVENKREVEQKLREAEQRKAALPVRHAPKKRPQLTQDALIAEALEVEETNRESLKRFLQLEEDRRARARLRKERIEGPFIRWRSVGMRPRVVAVQQLDRVAAEESADRSAAMPSQSAPNSLGPTADGHEALPAADQSIGGDTNTVGLSSEEGQAARADEVAEQAAETAAGGQDARPIAAVTPPPATTHQSTAAASAAEAPTPPLPATAAKGPTAPSQPPPPPTGPSNPPAAVASASTPSFTEDPAIAARAESQQHKAKLTSRTAAVPDATDPATPTVSAAAPNGNRDGLQARTLLSIERAPAHWDWSDDFRVLLGTHCDWTAVPTVPARNRPLRPRQSICPITGLPALYRDPRTGIPFANAKAYAILSAVLRSEYVWTGRGVDERDETQQGSEAARRRGGTPSTTPAPKKPRKSTTASFHLADGAGSPGSSPLAKGPAVRVGTGAAPIEMGCYIQHEAEAGAGTVFSDVRSRLHAAEAERAAASSLLGSGTDGKGGSAEATTAGTSGEKAKARYEMAWTSVLAPGDEQAIMAAAAQLPAGSTRSGRRGARKP